jgi:hypothetical protein
MENTIPLDHSEAITRATGFTIFKASFMPLYLPLYLPLYDTG